MNWKSTGVMGGLFALSLLAWWLFRPADEEEAIRPGPFAELREMDFRKIEINVPGQPQIVLERHPDPVQGVHWHLARPLARPADDVRVATMVSGLRRLERAGGIRTGTPEHDPKRYGLEEPVLGVVVHGAAGKQAIRFGKGSDANPDLRAFQIDGETDIYFGPREVFESLHRKAPELRSRSLVTYENHRVQGVLVERKELRVRHARDAEGKPKRDEKGLVPERDAEGKPILDVHYERTLFELVDRVEGTGAARGWYMVRRGDESVREKADEGQIGLLITEVRKIAADEFLDPAPDAEVGLDQPELRLTFSIREGTPVVVEFGNLVSKGDRKLRVARSGGELFGIADAPYERLPKQRGMFRSKVLFDFQAADLVMVQVQTLGRTVRLTAGVKEVERDGRTVRTGAWTVEEPRDIPVKEDLIPQFVERLLSGHIVSFLETQPDLASFGLDPAGVVAEFHVRKRDGTVEPRVYRFGFRGDLTGSAFVLKPGSLEVYEVPIDYWAFLERLDLNFRDERMFDVPRDSIQAIVFDLKDPTTREEVYYCVQKNPAGEWEFDERGRQEGKVIDREKLDLLLVQLNYIKAESFISRNERVIREHRLAADQVPYGRLTLRHLDPKAGQRAEERELRISPPIQDRSRQYKHYFARFAARPGEGERDPDVATVFRIRTELVERLKEGVAVERKPDTGTRPPDPPDHDHDHKKK